MPRRKSKDMLSRDKDAGQAGEPGEILSGDPMVITGYLACTTLDGFYTDEYGHWLGIGDQAIMAENGKVSLSGHYKNIIIVEERISLQLQLRRCLIPNQALW